MGQKTAAGFQIRESRGGKSNIAFDYRIVAKRRGYERFGQELRRRIRLVGWSVNPVIWTSPSQDWRAVKHLRSMAGCLQVR
jgi:hypothetical protein